MSDIERLKVNIHELWNEACMAEENDDDDMFFLDVPEQLAVIYAKAENVNHQIKFLQEELAEEKEKKGKRRKKKENKQ